MKTTTTFLLISLLSFGSVYSQSTGLKYSPEASLLLHDAEKYQYNLTDKSSLSQKFMDDYKVKILKNKAYVGALLKTNSQLTENDLKKMGVFVNTKAGNIWTANIPIDKIKVISELNGIDYIQLSKPFKSKLDNAIAETNVDNVHQGLNISSAFMGKDVVVGVVDGGYDYTHPHFYDTSGTNNRIKRVWNNSTAASPPAGFQFGSEFFTTATIEAAQTDDNNASHGSHVAGIAAGGGYGNPNNVGVAPMSDIIMVSTDIPSNGVDNVIDGINYIFQYATNEGKPAVVNLSLGSHVGPHDGSSLFDQALNNLVGPGKVVVGAAGNEGSKKLHLMGNLSNTDTMYTFVGNSGSDDVEIVDIWGESGKQFSVQALLLDTMGGISIAGSTAFVTSNSNTTHELFIVDSSNDTLYVAFTTNGSEFNQKPRNLVRYYNNSSLPWALAITAADATGSNIHLWNHADGNGAPFYSNGWSPLLDGNTAITVGEIGGTADSIITVGAYTTKNTYTNMSNNSVNIDAFAPIGQIASFSSLGPTVDGRIKPDVTAPGNVVVSSVNSFQASYNASTSNVVFSEQHNSKTYYYAALEGTSMATPMVTGIIALWLENYRNLSPYHIKQILSSTSRSDNFTGSSLPNNTWGEGKIDAYAGLVIVSLDENKSIDDSFTIYPNPAQDRIHLFSTEKIQEIMIFSYDGKLQKTIAGKGVSQLIDISDLSNGVYLMRVRKNNEMTTKRIVIAH